MSYYSGFLDFGKSWNKGLNQMELLWRAMHCHHDPGGVAMIVDKHASELHDRVSHLEGEMEFGFVKWSFSDEMGGSNDLCYLARVNYNTQKIHETLLQPPFLSTTEGSRDQVIHCIVAYFTHQQGFQN